tara:strand:- start:1172 stop:1384 length:213 start_codon:yes stop_codon:yes gene_type:complete
MRNKLTSLLADTLFVTVGATVIVARTTSKVTKSCVKEGKSFCTEVKAKYDDKKDERAYREEMQAQGVQSM